LLERPGARANAAMCSGAEPQQPPLYAYRRARLRLSQMDDRSAQDLSAGAHLRRLCETLVEQAGVSACLVSRVIGEMLIEVAESSANGVSLQRGHGYLIEDFPVTLEVITKRESRAVSLHEAEPDPAEAELLRELGYESLLMIPLEAAGECWGLVELYREHGEAFTNEDIALVQLLLAPAEQKLTRK
jgi:GAF domain-containing protein